MAHDGKRRRDAMSRWSQFVAMAVAQLGGRSSLRDIESAIDSQRHLSYHLGSRLIHLNLFARRDLIQLFRPPPDRLSTSPQLGLI